MARTPITSDLAVRNALPRDRPYKVSAGAAMYLLVTPKGAKHWRLKYRFGGREKTLTLGSYPLISLAEAKIRRDRARVMIYDGIDPMAHKRASQANTLTFGEVAERWFLNHTVKATVPWAPNTARKIRLYLDKDILPALGKRPIGDITRLELIAISERMEGRKVFDAASKVRGWLGDIFDDAFDRGEIQSNPALRLRPTAKSRGVKAKSRPTVAFEELPQLLQAIDATSVALSNKLAIRLMLLTAVRPGELRFAKWDEFDLTTRTWDIPADRMKMRKPHSVPLPSQAVAILEQLKRVACGSDYVLPGVRLDRPISDGTIGKVFKIAGYQGKQTGHGFRHLISTELNERGYNSDWIEAQLAHKTVNSDLARGMGADRSTYNHAVYWEQRAQMMQEWADAIEAIDPGLTSGALEVGHDR